MRELPVAQGLLVCERVEVDPGTNRLTFINRTTRHRADVFPTEPTGWSVFVALTNGFGSIPVTLVVEHLEAEAEVLKYRTTLEFEDRLREVPFLVRVRNLELPAAGTYQFTLFADDEPLARYLLWVSDPEAGE